MDKQLKKILNKQVEQKKTQPPSASRATFKQFESNVG